MSEDRVEAERRQIEQEIKGRTLCDLLAEHAAGHGDAPAMSWKRATRLGSRTRPASSLSRSSAACAVAPGSRSSVSKRSTSAMIREPSGIASPRSPAG